MDRAEVDHLELVAATLVAGFVGNNGVEVPGGGTAEDGLVRTFVDVLRALEKRTGRPIPANLWRYGDKPR
jgi:hypothetical protein